MRIVPIGTPLMYVVAQIKKAVGVRRIQAHRLGPALPTLGIIGNLLGERIPPRVERVLGATASGAFPLGFGGQAIALARRATQPLAIGPSFMPR